MTDTKSQATHPSMMRPPPTTTVASLLLAIVATGCPGASDDGGRADSATPTTTSSATSTASEDSADGTADTVDATTTSPPTTATSDTGDGTDTGGGSTDTDGVPETCGDMMVQPPEACDDGNAIDADGCNSDCTVSGSILWDHTQASGLGPDRAFGVAVDAADAAYVVGEFFGVDNDAWIRRYDPDGGLGFTTVVDSGGSDGARGVAVYPGGIYVTGYQGNDLFLRSYDESGTAGLALTYNGPASGGDVGHAVASDPGGNAIVAGHHTVNFFDGVSNIPHNDVFVRKYSPAGDVLWTHTYAGPISTGQDQARGVATDSLGNVIVVGWESVSGAGRNVWVRKLDADGNALWTVGYAGPDAMDDFANAVAVGPDDSVVVVGVESQMVTPTIVWMRKYDPDGNELWTQTWPGDTAEGAQALGAAVDEAGDILVTGVVTDAAIGTAFVRKHDPNGVLRWSTLVPGLGGGPSVGRGATVGPDQRPWAAGERDMGIDDIDVWVARLAQ